MNSFEVSAQLILDQINGVVENKKVVPRGRLIDRVEWAHANLKPYQTEYRIVFEDDIDSPAIIVIPDPNWMAMALHGDLLPPIEAVLKDKRAEENYKGEFFDRTYFPSVSEMSKPIGPMTEEEAIEYLIQKDVPEHVWSSSSQRNSKNLMICKMDQLPKSRRFRDAWRLKND